MSRCTRPSPARTDEMRLLLALALAFVPAAPSALRAQSLTGQVTGSIVDATGAALPGAMVTLTNAGTNWTRELQSSSDATFVFVDLVGGSYDLTVSLAGFKTLVQEGITVAATDRVSLPALVLEVGDVQETITVRRQSEFVQTTTGARSATITRDHIEDIALKGRDVMAMLVLVPGVIDTNPREAPSWTVPSGLSMNGRTGLNFSYDGVSNKSTDGPAVLAAPGLDSIAEVRVQSSNFQAEYGRSSGASITTVTRSGSSA